MKKDLLIGSFGAGNMGDEWILQSALQEYPQALVMTADKAASARWHGDYDWVCAWPLGIRSWVRFLLNNQYRQEVLNFPRKIERIIFPGGGLLAISRRAIWHWGMAFFWIKILFKNNINIHFEHQGIDPHFTRLEKLLMRWILQQCTTITVRDQTSAQAVQSLIGRTPKVVGDRVEKLFPHFSAENSVSRSLTLVQIKRPLTDTEKTYWKNYQEKQAVVWLVADQKDRCFYPSDCGPVIKSEDFETIGFLYAQAQRVVGQRLHFLLLGQVFLVPRVEVWGRPYAQKVRSFQAQYDWAQFSAEKTR